MKHVNYIKCIMLFVIIIIISMVVYSLISKNINFRTEGFTGSEPLYKSNLAYSDFAIDKNGNYTFGVNDQLIFPEIDYESVDQSLGFNISINTSAKNPKEGLRLLKKMGLPFHN